MQDSTFAIAVGAAGLAVLGGMALLKRLDTTASDLTVADLSDVPWAYTTPILNDAPWVYVTPAESDDPYYLSHDGRRWALVDADGVYDRYRRFLANGRRGEFEMRRARSDGTFPES